VRRACIDIGSNTTRLLVADCHREGLLDVHQERAFTKIGHGLRREGLIDAGKIAEVVDVVGAQIQTARALGASEVRGVATAAIRGATNGSALVEAIERACGLRVEILSGTEEARLAFVGAARTLGHAPTGELGVVDVGGGSSELVVGTMADGVSWSASFRVGSAFLADGYLRSDPPSVDELDRVRMHVAGVFEGLDVPQPDVAYAVGGSATSLRRVVGAELNRTTLAHGLSVLGAAPAAEVARRYELHPERVRVLPAGMLLLDEASRLFDCELRIASGGLREGVVLEDLAAVGS
jgi:exopolyphosphatase / guanosine-5'-triphosphate,3'-diphosphate pyrophosphatase